MIEFAHIFVLQLFNMSSWNTRDWRRKRRQAANKPWRVRIVHAWRMACCYTWILKRTQDSTDWRMGWMNLNR